ncbi:hypothetical protein CYMTET_25174 [Cymbomonas tetramitiformis]|uniref:EF-hand domain-containing protein n=1 Tax=Cymbomonas tetramitiformis TaxID=36881 RepID=A0AAE0FV27_9CHLO|nr:hypothetical protein CYMTET_25174 [Cymbomonas tetramitiformis]
MTQDEVSKRLSKSVAGSRTALERMLLSKSGKGTRDTISRYEFRSAVQSCSTGLSFSDIGALMTLLDPDNSGEVSISKFWQKAGEDFPITKKAGEVLGNSTLLTTEGTPRPRAATTLSASNILLGKQGTKTASATERTRYSVATPSDATSPVSRFFAVAGTKLPDYGKEAASAASGETPKAIVSPTLSTESSSSTSKANNLPTSSSRSSTLRQPSRTSFADAPGGPVPAATEFPMPTVTQARASMSSSSAPPVSIIEPGPTLSSLTDQRRASSVLNPPAGTPYFTPVSQKSGSGSDTSIPVSNTSAAERTRVAHEKIALDEKEGQLTQLRLQNEQLNTELQSLREIKADFESKVGPLLEELNEKKRQVEANEKNLGLQEEQMRQTAYEKEKLLRGQVEQLQRSLDEAKTLERLAPDKGPVAELEANLKAEHTKTVSLENRVREMEHLLRNEESRREAAEKTMMDTINKSAAASKKAAGDGGEQLALKEELHVLRAALGAEKEGRAALENGFSQARESLWAEREAKEVLEAELVVLRSEVSAARSAVSGAVEATQLRETAQELQAQLHEASQGRAHAEAECDRLRAALVESKEEVITLQDDERARTEELMERERRLLLTLMKQLQSSQQEQLRLDDYCEEMDKVYVSLEKLYSSLKNEDGPSLTQIVEETKPGQANQDYSPTNEVHIQQPPPQQSDKNKLRQVAGPLP